MTMAIDNHQRHFGAIPLDHMSYQSSSPQFTNPWASTSSANFPTSLSSSGTGFEALAKQQSQRSTTSMPYSSIPAPASSINANSGFSNSAYQQPEMLGLSQDLMTPRSTYDQGYSTATSSAVNAYTPTSAPYVGPYGSLPNQQQDTGRRLSHQSSASSSSQSQTSFSDALDAGRGMVAMSQDMITPRNIYGPRGDRGSTDSYGFPSAHSSHSSISSGSTYPSSYYGSSVDSSVSDYSSQSEMGDPINPRTLPRPSGLVAGGMPPAPQSMMGQFNSKVSSSTQKKHKCKVCDKRFTRPSSLQTHMYSHTGEKPYACEHEGCGRHFSVVSNLRRHRKVHKGERFSDHESPEGSWASEK